MGAINNAFNQAAGAVATAAYGIEKIKEAQIAEGEIGKEQLIKNADDAVKADAEVTAAKSQVANMRKESKALDDIQDNLDESNQGDLKTFHELSIDLNKDSQKADLALLSAKLKAKAIKESTLRAQQKIKKANEWLGLEEEDR